MQLGPKLKEKSRSFLLLSRKLRHEIENGLLRCSCQAVYSCLGDLSSGRIISEPVASLSAAARTYCQWVRTPCLCSSEPGGAAGRTGGLRPLEGAESLEARFEI